MRNICVIIILTALSACAGGDRANLLGIDRNKPDEFAILKSSPLVIPSNNSSLPAPRSLAEREKKPEMRGEVIITEKNNISNTPRDITVHEKTFIKVALGNINPDPKIRDKIDTEYQQKNTSFLEKANPINLGDKIVSSKKEYNRLQELKKSGKPLNSGNVIAQNENQNLLKAILQ